MRREVMNDPVRRRAADASGCVFPMQWLGCTTRATDMFDPLPLSWRLGLR